MHNRKSSAGEDLVLFYGDCYMKIIISHIYQTQER